MLNWNDVIRFAREGNPQPTQRVEKTAAEWRQLLTDAQFHITREHGTERPFSGEYCQAHTAGLYACVCCGNALFDSRQKFDSGTGWPSFNQPMTDNAIQYIEDNSYGMQRIEVRCNTCDAHQGHVFPDGPAPSGLRYCINSLAIRRIKTD